MAEETQKPAAAPDTASTAAPAPEVVVVAQPLTEKAAPPAAVPEPEVPEKKPEAVAVADEVVAAATSGEGVEEVEKAIEEEAQITSSVSFKEETNVVSELPEAQKKALDDLKLLIQEALNKHEFTAPPPPPAAAAAAKEEEKAEVTTEVKADETAEVTTEVKAEEKAEEKPAAPSTSEEPKVEEKAEVKAEVKVEVKEEEKKIEPPAASADEDGAKTVEAIEETIVAVSSAPPPTEEAKEAETPAPPEEAGKEGEDVPPPPPEEVSIWGIPILGDERSDVILLKFLRARDFKVKDAFTMIKNAVKWRKEFGIDELLEEDLGNEFEKLVFMHGVDKEGHPVCYNVYGAFQDKEMYQNCFADEEKRVKFMRWRIQFLEKSIRNLDFTPNGICTIVQVNDLKNSPGPFKWELRQATNQALTLLQDNYPEFVAKQIFINVPWWYLAFNRMISPFLTQRTKSKFVFAGLSKSAETLSKYVAPEQVPIQYGGLKKGDGQEFSVDDSVTDVLIKATSTHTIEIPASEACSAVWELRVVGWDVSYGAEFVPSAEDGYTVIVSKTRKVSSGDEPLICDTFKIGEPGKVVLTIDNQTSKKKKLLYRAKTKAVSE